MCLKNIELDANGRIPKSEKPDFEALTEAHFEGEKFAIVVGSGSKFPKRDDCYMVNLITDKISYKIFTSLYANLKKQAQIPVKNKINIEAIANTDNDIFLFHRGNISGNIIFQFRANDFMNYVIGSRTFFPNARMYRFNLLKIKNIESGFSGAVALPNQSGLLVTSSVEDTIDEINDGAILDSFIGILSFDKMDKLDNSHGADFKVLEQNGSNVITKVESISIKEIKLNGDLLVVTASENDNGISEFFEIELCL